MRIGIWLASAAALLAGASGQAQRESGGHPDLTARASNFAASRMFEDRQDILRRNACEKTGCLFLVNRSPDQEIVELRFDTVAPGAPHEPVWSENALRRPVRPQQTVGLMKFGDASLCGLPARLLLKDRRNGTQEELRGTMNLCKAQGVEVFSVGASK